MGSAVILISCAELDCVETRVGLKVIQHCFGVILYSVAMSLPYTSEAGFGINSLILPVPVKNTDRSYGAQSNSLCCCDHILRRVQHAFAVPALLFWWQLLLLCANGTQNYAFL
jgi:hypothetical protein